MKIRINSYDLKNPKIKSNITILNISDIHSNIKALDKVIDLIKDIKIDYIFIPGDTVDNLDKKNEKAFLERVIYLSRKAKTFISIGNHDKYIDNKGIRMIDNNSFLKTNFYNTLSSAPNITVFTNSYSSIRINENYTISAINYPNDYYARYESKKYFNSFISAFNNNEISNISFNILLSHTPNCLIEKRKIIDNSFINKNDLILCGHNHGGLTPIWLQKLRKNSHYGIFGPFNHFGQKNAFGIYTNNKTNILVSSGITKLSDLAYFKLIHKPVNSILCPEIDIINLENGQENDFKLIKRKKYKI